MRTAALKNHRFFWRFASRSLLPKKYIRAHRRLFIFFRDLSEDVFVNKKVLYN